VINEEPIEKGLRCPIDKSDTQIFFSLVDYLNSLYTSKDPRRVIEFYNGFHSMDELMEWMKERPKGVPWIREVEGQKDIIVVIPTADFNGKYAKECRDNIFKGLHMIFVESGGKNDFYFNFAHYVNAGVKKALEYKPKWIIYSGDDMYKIDDVNVLVRQLKNINEENYNAVFTKPARYHSAPCKIMKINSFYNLFNLVTNYNAGRIRIKLYRKFNVEFTSMRSKYALIFSFPRKSYPFIESLDFLILSRKFVEQEMGNIFDETYVLGGEDVDLSLRISFEREKIAFINYKIGDYVGSTLGLSNQRWIREIAAHCYFDFKWRNRLQKIIST